MFIFGTILSLVGSVLFAVLVGTITFSLDSSVTVIVLFWAWIIMWFTSFVAKMCTKDMWRPANRIAAEIVAKDIREKIEE